MVDKILQKLYPVLARRVVTYTRVIVKPDVRGGRGNYERVVDTVYSAKRDVD